MFAGASLDENSGAFCELKANFFRLILTKAEFCGLTTRDLDFKNKDTDLYRLYNTNIHEKIAMMKKEKLPEKVIERSGES